MAQEIRNLSPDMFEFVNMNERLTDVKFDFEIPLLENFLTVQEISCKVAKILKVNRWLALLSWAVLIPPAILSALENPPVPFNPLMAALGVAIFGVIIAANSLRIRGERS